jgi:hypothetical protein
MDGFKLPHKYERGADLQYADRSPSPRLRVIGRIVRENRNGEITLSYRTRQNSGGRLERDTLEIDEADLCPVGEG